ncbi:MAG: phosphoribosylformylglycinamidine cyclo-ligase [Nitrospinota bacterium]|nr:phosphoribosylformylglycinamidine cyclo-ligase [Nitrospinota bacterium]
MDERPSLTYRSAGVDVSAGESFAEKIAGALRSTHLAHPGRILGEGSGFAGMFRLGASYRDPVLVSGTDGVGTKLKLVQRLGAHAGIGVDLVAMCVNDVITSGAAPLFFLDYIASGKLEPEVLASVVDGIAQGCLDAGCALLGGETAEMPDFYEAGVYDLAGFAVGAVEREEILEASNVRGGDVLIGLLSSGIHSNGYSLVRRVFDDPDEWAGDEIHPGLDTSLKEALLAPTRIYASAANAIRGQKGVHAIAHVTGGGLPGNVNRILPPSLQAVFRPGSWPEPGIFGLIEKRGPVRRDEMFGTFNMGIGLVVAADSGAAGEVMDALRKSGEAPCRAGEVRARKEGAAVVVEGVEP